MAKRLTYQTRAPAIAETGAQKAYIALMQNFSLRTNAAAFAPTVFAGGSYDVTVTPLGQDNALITSTGTYRSIDQAVMIDVKMFRPKTRSDLAAYAYGILANGEISWSGCGVFNGGSLIHANDDIKQAGSSTIFTYVETIPVAPNELPTEGALCVSAWQK